jgi:hypothetical protein
MYSTCFGYYYTHHQELANVLLNYHIRRFVLSSLCVGDLVQLGLSSACVAGWSTICCTSAWNTDTTQTQTRQISNTQRTENKTTDVVIQQHSRKLLMMDKLISETCWVHKKWNKIASDIKLVFYSSTITITNVHSTALLFMWQLRFSLRWLWRVVYYGMWRLVIW